MTSWHSLLACAQADVTVDRIAALAAATGTEPLTVEFKKHNTPRIADCVAAMANGYGGLIFVGITDSDHEIVGVKTETMAYIADMLSARLDPADWLPEMFEVPLGSNQPDKYVVVIRVRYETAPRPVLVQRTVGSGDDRTNMFWLPVRRPGGIRQATRAEMANLFSEQPGALAQQTQWDVQGPQLPSTQGNPESAVDLMLKTGLFITPGPAAAGRPLSERVVDILCSTLDNSPLKRTLFDLMHVQGVDAFQFGRRGVPNTSTTATLTYQFAGKPEPFEVKVRIEAPDQYGHSHIQTLQVTMEVVSRVSAWNHHEPELVAEVQRRRFDVSEWTSLLESVIATLTDPNVVSAFADLADVDPILVPAPRILHVLSGVELTRILPNLAAIPGTGHSHGAALRADPTLDLADPDDRARQVNRWLCQISADAGLRGMEYLISAKTGNDAQ